MIDDLKDPIRSLSQTVFLNERSDTTPTGPGKSARIAVIEVYADIWCPFAHVGLRAAVRRRHELGRDDVALRVRAWPLELVNNAPLDRATTLQHAHELREEAASDLFAGFDGEAFPPSSLAALALAAAAYRQDDASGEAMSIALRNALFEEGQDISRADVLGGLARKLRVPDATAADEETVRNEWHDGTARGVKGSPHFFCEDLDVFCPSLDIAKDSDGHLQLRRNIEALDRFLSDCFQR